jgi:polyisoprenoid-binding protein YceI
MTAVLLAGLLAASSATATTAEARRYELVDEPGALYVLLEPQASSLFGFMAHEHVVEARGYSGFVRYVPGDPGACRIEVDVPVSGLVVDRPEMREAVGIEGDISEGDRETVADHMRREDQLHADAYDMIRFRGKRCEPLEGRDGLFRIIGDLEIRGETTEIRVPAKVRFEGDTLHAESNFSEVHESFGFEPYSAFGGTVANARMIRFRVRVRAERP